MLLFKSECGNGREPEIERVESRLDALGITHSRAGSEPINSDFDAVIALGGDGTMLTAAHIAIDCGLPLLGINFGTLGYMSGLESGELELLESLTGEPEFENRMLLEVRVTRDGELTASYTALNEAAISRRPEAGIAKLELKCDGTKVCGYRSDGVIIATPTGSSAYAMSAGGPIIDTKLDAFCVCPICPHSMSSRAMVFSSRSSLSIINGSADGDNLLTADGHFVARLNNGDIVTVNRSESELKLIKLKPDAFYEVLYRKMT